MASLSGLLPSQGLTNWRKSRALTESGEGDGNWLVRHIIIREVWLEKRPWPHAVYKVDVMSQTSHWFVFKRFKEFYALHQKLVKEFHIPRDMLPPRKLANNMSAENLEHRREALEHYLQRLLNSCNGTVRRSDHLLEFLDVKSHDVTHVTNDLAVFLKKNGASILMSKEMFHMTPNQLYCITKQLQLPHPEENEQVDLGILYDFIHHLERLSITDIVGQSSDGEQHEISFSFDISIFTSLNMLQMDACDLGSVRGVAALKWRLRKLTARHCLGSMKTLLIDAAIEKRPAPQVTLSAESWRVQAAFRLSENRVVMNPWHCLVSVNFSHNSISQFDNSLNILPALKQLDLSYNKLTHLDLQLLTPPRLETLNLANNQICLISGTTQPLDSLRHLNLSSNKIQTVEGLLSLPSLENLNICHNVMVQTSEVNKLSSLPILNKLLVAGNYFTKKKRHRIIILAYFRDRNLLLDNRPITRKERAKIDSKMTALENLQDMDDSLSSISSVSDDSDLDSGIIDSACNYRNALNYAKQSEKTSHFKKTFERSSQLCLGDTRFSRRIPDAASKKALAAMVALAAV